MARASHTWEDYNQIAKERDLRFAGKTLPAHREESTTWVCLKCGRTLHKSFRAVKYNPNGCLCRSGATLTAQHYHELAAVLGIIWLGPADQSFSVPENTKQKTRWQGTTGEIVEASYHQLAYTRISRAMATKLGMPDPGPAGIVGTRLAATK